MDTNVHVTTSMAARSVRNTAQFSIDTQSTMQVSKSLSAFKCAQRRHQWTWWRHLASVVVRTDVREKYKRFSYRRETARRSKSVEILLNTAHLCEQELIRRWDSERDLSTTIS